MDIIWRSNMLITLGSSSMIQNYHHFVGIMAHFTSYNRNFGRLKCLPSFLNAIQNDNSGTTACILGDKYVLGHSKNHFNPLALAWVQNKCLTLFSY